MIPEIIMKVVPSLKSENLPPWFLCLRMCRSISKYPNRCSIERHYFNTESLNAVARPPHFCPRMTPLGLFAWWTASWRTSSTLPLSYLAWPGWRCQTTWRMWRRWMSSPTSGMIFSAGSASLSQRYIFYNYTGIRFFFEISAN